jgi:carboxylesterase
MSTSALHNPHLDGRPFFLEGGPVGVLLCHGFTATTVEVRDLAERLHAHGYTVSGPLLPGHGTTPEEMNRTRWREWLAHVEGEYHRLATLCDQVFVGGESTGAIIGLYLASRYHAIKGVLAYAPAIKLNIRPLDLVKLYLAAPFLLAVPKGSLDVGGRWQGYPVNPLKATIQLLRFQRVVRRRLGHIHQPVLVVQGRLDTTVHPSAGEIIRAGVISRITEQHWMEESSHVVLLDREIEAITDLTLAFLRRARSERARGRGGEERGGITDRREHG